MIDLEWVKEARAAAREAATRFNSDERTRQVGGASRDREPGYNGATFLFVRAYEGDQGIRPVPANTVFWLSPDVELYDAAGICIATSEIKDGASYTVQVVVTNGGDLDCNVCQVELYLDDPSIGFGPAASKLVGASTTAVGHGSSATVVFPFIAGPSAVGHRCLFARVSSFVTNDLPSDWAAFNACADRHLGQQNLNIVPQGQAFEFWIQLAENRRDKTLVLTLEPNHESFRTARFATLGRYLLAERAAAPAAFEIAAQGFGAVVPGNEPAAREGPATRPGGGRVAAATASLLKERESRWLFSSANHREGMRVDVPHLGLRRNEALPMDLRLTDRSSGEVVGGITLLVAG